MKELGDFYDPKDLREYDDPRPEWLKGKFGDLSDRDILRCLEDGIIEINPLPDTLADCINSCKIDFHLGSVLTIYKSSKITEVDLGEDPPPEFQEDIVVRDGDYYALHPQETVLAQTKESLILPSYIIARVEGKSRNARKGLGIELAAIIDAGWTGQPTLELHNNGKAAIKLRPPQAIGAFSFHLLTSPALFPYQKQRNSRYKNQSNPRF